MSDIPDNSAPAADRRRDFDMFYGAFVAAADKVVGLHPPDKRRHIAVIGNSGTGKTSWASMARHCLVILPETQGKGRVQDSNPLARLICLADINTEMNKKAAESGHPAISMADTLRGVLKWLKVEVYAQNDDGSFINLKVEGGEQVWPPPYLVLDGGTEACRILASELGPKGKDDFGAWYSKIDERCMNLIRAFRDLPCTFVCTWLNDPDLVEGLNTQRLKVPWKKTAGPVSTLFDMVFWAFVQEKVDTEGRLGGTIESPVTYSAYGIKTDGGEFGGYQLEHGKGHEAIPQWINPRETAPSDLIDAIEAYGREKASKAGLKRAKGARPPEDPGPAAEGADVPPKKAPAKKKKAPAKKRSAGKEGGEGRKGGVR